MTMKTRATKTALEHELATQPENWARAAEIGDAQTILPPHGSRVAVVGCASLWFMAQAYARLREEGGFGETDAFAASEASIHRDYDVIIALTRSGKTEEVLRLVADIKGRTSVIGVVGEASSPLIDLADTTITVPFADDRFVVQTSFATTVLALLRASLGEDLSAVIEDGRRALAENLDPVLLNAEQYSFVGRGWAVGLVHAAALEIREASQAWTESYPSMEYREGPIAIAAPGRVTWHFGDAPHGLATEVERTGAHFEQGVLDPMAELVRAQRVALSRTQGHRLNLNRTLQRLPAEAELELEKAARNEVAEGNFEARVGAASR